MGICVWVCVCVRWPGLMADTGRIRCPINLPFSSSTAILKEANVGSTIWRETGVNVKGDGLKDRRWRARETSERHLNPGMCSNYLFKDKRIIIPHRVQRVPIGRFGSVLPLCITRKSNYVHFHIHTHLFIWQELAWNHLLDIALYILIVTTLIGVTFYSQKSH